jgi:hypothetical protein
LEAERVLPGGWVNEGIFHLSETIFLKAALQNRVQEVFYLC